MTCICQVYAIVRYRSYIRHIPGICFPYPDAPVLSICPVYAFTFETLLICLHHNCDCGPNLRLGLRCTAAGTAAHTIWIAEVSLFNVHRSLGSWRPHWAPVGSDGGSIGTSSRRFAAPARPRLRASSRAKRAALTLAALVAA